MGAPVLGACIYKEKFILLEGQLYQERLGFNCFKNIIKMYLENKKNVYLTKKKPKSFQGLKVGPGPWPINAHFVCTWLCFAPVGDFARKNILAPPDLNPGSATGNDNWHF